MTNLQKEIKELWPFLIFYFLGLVCSVIGGLLSLSWPLYLGLLLIVFGFTWRAISEKIQS